jgi:hypothetical protein
MFINVIVTYVQKTAVSVSTDAVINTAVVLFKASSIGYGTEDLNFLVR